MQPRQLVFVHQLVDIPRSTTETASPRQTGLGHSRGPSSDSRAPGNLTYSAQMAVYVVFEKKAGIIRIADAAVAEVEMYDMGNGSSLLSNSTKDSLSVGSSLGSRRSRASIDFMAFKEAKGTWILPSLVDLPALGGDAASEKQKSVYVLTRGKHTHIIPAPLPAIIQQTPPIHSLVWSSSPSSVNARVCIPQPARTKSQPDTPPFLQLVAFSEDGIQVEEIPLAALVNGGGSVKGKGKGVALAESCRGQSFIGETGFLAHGGHWHRLPSEITAPALERTDSTTSARSFESVHTEEVVKRLKAEAGVYGWLRKSVEDWRVFWVGGDAREVGGHRDSEEEDGVLV